MNGVTPSLSCMFHSASKYLRSGLPAGACHKAARPWMPKTAVCAARLISAAMVGVFSEQPCARHSLVYSRMLIDRVYSDYFYLFDEFRPFSRSNKAHFLTLNELLLRNPRYSTAVVGLGLAKLTGVSAPATRPTDLALCLLWFAAWTAPIPSRGRNAPPDVTSGRALGLPSDQ